MAPPSAPPQDPEPEGLDPAETRRALWVAAIAWGLFGSTWMSLTSGAPLVTFAREKLGANDLWYGLISALPFIGVLAQLPASWWVERSGRRRPLFLLAGCIHRGLWLLVAAIPWIIPEAYRDTRLLTFLLLTLMSALLAHAATPAWFSWYADIIPEHTRARYLSYRSAISTVTIVLVSVLTAYLLDRHSSFLFFTIIFGLAGAIGMVDILLFISVREPPLQRSEGPSRRFSRLLTVPLQSRPFRGYLLYVFSTGFMFGIASPFFWLVGLEFLQISKSEVNLFIVILPMVCTALMLPVWGNWHDRFGSRALVTVGVGSTLLFPLCWLIATPGHYHLLFTFAAITAGLFNCAIQVADANMIFSLTPRASRSSYIAVVGLANSLGWATAPILGGYLAEVLQDFRLAVGGLTFINLHLLILLALLLRLFHLLLIVPRLPVETVRPTRELLTHILLAPLLHLRHLVIRDLDQSHPGTKQ